MATKLGIVLNKNGRVQDSIFFMPAYNAGITPGMTVVAVNGRKYSADVIHDALKAAKNSKEPVQLLVENNDYFKSYSINYHEGDKYPHLVRDESRPDLLTDIMKAHATK